MTEKMKVCQLPSPCATRVTSDCVCCVIINVDTSNRQDMIHGISLFTSFVHVNCYESSTACILAYGR